jgi:EAL domain-containing protein (putative c-di-GMP-specific phosphodiesterase class I)
MGVIIAAFALLFILLLYFILESHQSKKALAVVNDWNANLKCDTRTKFIRNADEIMRENTGTTFAVISIEVKHFNYLVSHCSNHEVENVLQFLKLLYKNTIRLDETFGYESDGTFLLLWRFKEEEVLANRLINIKNIAQKYEQGLPLGFRVNLVGGIAVRGIGEQLSAKKLAERATTARISLNQRFSFSTFRFYSEHFEFERMIKENIETQMESGLENEEFEIFLQPKLNITTNRLAGAEALARWFSKSLNEQLLPDSFIPLFEANGFIEKLDFYVFEHVCKMIRTSLDEGKMILPVSVNVSRVTSSKDDFLEKYINTKKRFRVPDGFLTIEFTESYAYEEYERLKNVVDMLRVNGFKCSIDDFGTKYSTYNTLKVLTMDELKLDKFFIEPGPSDEKSIAIIENVINLAHKFNLTVVQEGVETKEQMMLLKSLGCDVIQGFYCSKPIPWEEYPDFIINHKIKNGY